MKLKRRTKANRANWLITTLESRGVARYGMQSALAKELGCSKSTAQNWCRGGIGSGELAIEFAYHYDFSLADWVWENFEPSMIGPKTAARAKEVFADAVLEELNQRDKLSQRALNKTITFVANHVNPGAGEKFSDDWQTAFQTIFKIILKNEELGIDAMEDLGSVAELAKKSILLR